MGLTIGLLPIRAAMHCELCGGVTIGNVPNLMTSGTQDGRIVLRVDVLSTRRCDCCGRRSAFTILREYDDDGNEIVGDTGEPE